MGRRDIETSMSLLPTSVCVSVCLMMGGIPSMCGSSPHHTHKSDSAPLALVPDAAGKTRGAPASPHPRGPPPPFCAIRVPADNTPLLNVWSSEPPNGIGQTHHQPTSTTAAMAKLS